MPVQERTIRRLNLVDAGVETRLNISPDQIPTLVPKEVMNEWLSGDDKPYYKLQRIEYPITANGLVYEESFFESFIGKMNERPIPGSKDGHTSLWSPARGATDFVLVGGKIEKNGDGTGRVYFKNYIPPVGESGSNEIFIRENKSDMIHYSLVTYPREIIERNEEGTTVRIVESMFGERNDAVDFGTGAMEQVTNSSVVDKTTENSGNNKETSAEAGQGEKSMNKDEILAKLNSLRQNGDITLLEVAESMGLKEQVMTDEIREAVAVVNKIKESGVKDVIAEFNRLKAVETEGAKAKRANELTEAFGPEKFKDGSENLVRTHAERMYNSNMTIDQIKEDPVTKRLQADQADYQSEVNKIGIVDTNGKTPEPQGPEVVDEY